MKYFATIGSTIGSTPLVQLNRIAAGLPAQIFVKLEFLQSGAKRQGPHRRRHDRRPRKPAKSHPKP